MGFTLNLNLNMKFLPPLLVLVMGLVCVVYSEVPTEESNESQEAGEAGGYSENDILTPERRKRSLGHLIANGVGHLSRVLDLVQRPVSSVQRPVTSSVQRPVTSSVQRPATSSVQRPATSSVQRPATSSV